MSAITPETRSPFSEQIQEFEQFAILQMERILKAAFAMTQAGGFARNLVLVWGSGVLWIFIALTTRPFETYVLQGFSESLRKIVFFFANPNPVYSLVEGTVRIGVYSSLMVAELLVRLLSPEVLRHVLPIAVPFFIALRIATLYLKDIFELEHEGIASHFIRQTAFAFTYHTLTIENGRVAEKDKESPLLLIGGPGIVHAKLENVAIFEKLNGQVHIIGQKPGGKKASNLIDAFERLREVIDLRNQRTQANELAVEGRTRDGIRIIVKNIRIDFSVLRDVGGGASSTATNPYSYKEDALKSLVFKRGPNVPWTSIMKGMVRRNLQEFIAEHRLSEFLAASDLPGTANQGPLLKFIPRQELTELFVSPRFIANAARMGLQLNWIDVGTWVAPASTTLVTQKNLDAWKITCENETRHKNLDIVEKESRLEELTRLIREVPLITNADARAQNKLDVERKIDLIFAYLGLLRSAQADKAHRQLPPSIELDATINFLSSYLKDYQERTGKVRWL
jgi:hypothetical protein